MEDVVLQLGGNIELSGFSELDGGMMIVLKKIIGNHARRMNEKTKNFEKLSLTVKSVHEKETNKIYELHVKLIDNGKPITSSNEHRNLFIAVDSALKSVMAQLK